MARFEKYGASYVIAISFVPTTLLTDRMTVCCFPLPAGIVHDIAVSVFHAVEAHKAAPTRRVGVELYGLKLRPASVVTAEPVVGPFVPRKVDTTGASKLNVERPVPTIDARVTRVALMRLSCDCVLHRTKVPVDHEVVSQARDPSTAELVASDVAKFRPKSVRYARPPVAGEFSGFPYETMGASKVKFGTEVPRTPLICIANAKPEAP